MNAPFQPGDIVVATSAIEDDCGINPGEEFTVHKCFCPAGTRVWHVTLEEDVMRSAYPFFMFARSNARQIAAQMVEEGWHQTSNKYRSIVRRPNESCFDMLLEVSPSRAAEFVRNLEDKAFYELALYHGVFETKDGVDVDVFKELKKQGMAHVRFPHRKGVISKRFK